ncbi:MAG: MotA/TolQ/ExbB proton channel family protein [Pseudomonadota bacterium]|jgi:biopolymer transport protein ExbB
MTPTDTPVSRLLAFLVMGGPAMWAIATLSVLTLALILWKTWRLAAMGAFNGGGYSACSVAMWESGDRAGALAQLRPRRSARARVISTAMAAVLDPRLDRAAAEATTEQAARALLNQARQGLRGLELAAAIGPLLGLLGTVTGMIAAFQGLEAAGVRADTSVLAGGIWEALLTTAAGMAVAIPAMIAQSWFEGVIENMRHDMEDGATRVFLGHAAPKATLAQAAE